MTDMKDRFLTCIVCPRGCQLTVKFDSDGKISDISGQGCKRGITYAENECTHPMRTVTTTAKCEDGKIISVKTSSAVPKERVFDVMREINATRVKSDIQIGQVVIKDVLSLGVDVIATSNGNF